MIRSIAPSGKKPISPFPARVKVNGHEGLFCPIRLPDVNVSFEVCGHRHGGYGHGMFFALSKPQMLLPKAELALQSVTLLSSHAETTGGLHQEARHIQFPAQ